MRYGVETKVVHHNFHSTPDRPRPTFPLRVTFVTVYLCIPSQRVAKPSRVMLPTDIGPAIVYLNNVVFSEYILNPPPAAAHDVFN